MKKDALPQKNSESKEKVYYYAVAVGREPGIYTDRLMAQSMTHRISGAIMKKFKTYDQAENFIKTTSEKKRYYAVSSGIKTGVYDNLKEARLQTHKVSNSSMKAFNNYKDATNYVNQHHSQEKATVKKTKLSASPKKKKKKKKKKNTKNDCPTVYIDGSYMENVSISSYGFVVEHKEEVLQKDFGILLDKDILKLKSFGAELHACLRAMEWAIANNLKEIRIVYDCDGIHHLISSGKAKCTGRKKFLKLFLAYAKYLKVYFRRVNNDQLKKKHKASHDLSRTYISIDGI